MEDYELANLGITLLTTTGKCNHLGIEITIPFTSSRMYVILKFRFFLKHRAVIGQENCPS